MSKPDLKDLGIINEIDLTVRGRKSGKDLSRPVWFVQEDDKLYLLPVQGSDTNWYRNVLKNPSVKISVKGQELRGSVKTITDDNRLKKYSRNSDRNTAILMLKNITPNLMWA